MSNNVRRLWIGITIAVLGVIATVLPAALVGHRLHRRLEALRLSQFTYDFGNDLPLGVDYAEAS